MARSTIDFGIDLGTTNSAIAVLRDVGADVIKNNDDADITPSAVSIDRDGEVRVGARAKARSALNPNDAFREFKRRMGTDHVYRFRQAKLEKRPEDLSAEVLKELRSSVQQRMGETIDAAVITVPAAFELPQCDATRRSAQLAGIIESPLLQEPVAAALAYGFQIETQKAYWLVYDFGGGTFDAALVKSEEGTIRVVNHGGDNFIGGADIDLAIVNELLVPRIVEEHGLIDFKYTNKRWESAFALLKRAAEIAKLELSRKDKQETRFDECRFDDGKDNTIEVDYKVTRDDIRRIAEPFVARSAEICKRVLREKHLNRNAVERVILVGGPTLAPYFREMLADQLRIPLDHTVDPLTVVARGAAIFAGTQRRTTRTSGKASAKTFTLDLKYNPVGVDTNPLIGGKILPPSGTSLDGFTLELVDQKTRWRSGKIPVAKGIFTATLRAEPGLRNTYSIELLDSTGTRWPTVPDVLTYTIGAAVSEQVLPQSLGIELVDNKFDRIFEKGHSLPAKASRRYGADHPLRRGESGAALRVPVCEGEAARADRNKPVGSLVIEASDIPRDLPKGSEIEITVRIDESREITVEAYVPVLDKDFKAVLKSGLVIRPAAELQADVTGEKERLDRLRDHAVAANDKETTQLVDDLAGGKLMRSVRALAESASDPDDARKCEDRLFELKLKIDLAEGRLEWPQIEAETEDFIGRLQAAVEEGGDSRATAQAEALAADLRRLIKARKSDDLQEKRSQAEGFYWRTMMAQPGFWIYMLQGLEKAVDTMTDKDRAVRLLDQGRAAISHNNIDALRNVVNALREMLPEDESQSLQHGYRSGVRQMGS